MSEEKRTDEQQKKNTDFLVEPLAEDELEDVSGGNAPEGCANGTSCSNGSPQMDDTLSS